MLQLAKSVKLLRCLGVYSSRYLSSGNGEGDNEGSVNVDKLTGFFKHAEEKLAKEAAEKLAKEAAEKLAKEAAEKLVKETEKKLSQEAQEKSAIETANISETISPNVQESAPFPTSVSESTSSGPSKKLDDGLRRFSTAPRLVPWTSNRFVKEYRAYRSRFSATSPAKSFATLLRESTFVQLGNFNQREVVGVVIENVNDSDLYIDFGGKFLAVVSQPENSFYPRGSLVRIRLRDPEMANRFMVNIRAISLLEADATLIGPYRGQLTTTPDSNSTSPSLRSNKDILSMEHWKL
ncbi:hypothetical protein Aperf_G00000027309 [Anoplocephala perfoliata]